MIVSFEFALRLVPGLNAREHWAVRAKRVTNEKRTTLVEWLAQVKGKPSFDGSVTVRLTRIFPGKMDGDNLQGTLKNCRDRIAERMKVDDGDERITWLYAQERGAKHRVRVEIYHTPYF